MQVLANLHQLAERRLPERRFSTKIFLCFGPSCLSASAQAVAMTRIAFTERYQSDRISEANLSMSFACSLADSGLLPLAGVATLFFTLQNSRSSLSQPPSSSLFDLAMMFSFFSLSFCIYGGARPFDLRAVP
jgi:hypothetical protein